MSPTNPFQMKKIVGDVAATLPPTPQPAGHDLLDAEHDPRSRYGYVLHHLMVCAAALGTATKLDPRQQSQTSVMLEQTNQVIAVLEGLPPKDDYSPEQTLGSVSILANYHAQISMALQRCEAGEVSDQPSQNDPDFMRRLLADLTLALKRLSA